MKKGTTGEASVHVEVSPDAAYKVVSDVTRMGEWSPECVRCEWLDGAAGPVVGAKFVGHNRRGLARWTTKPRVVAAEPGREFAFVTDAKGKDLVRWTYRFEPDGSGTKVTESFEMMNDEPTLYDFGMRYLMRIKDRKADLEAGMRATLGRIKTAVESRAEAT